MNKFKKIRLFLCPVSIESFFVFSFQRHYKRKTTSKTPDGRSATVRVKGSGFVFLSFLFSLIFLTSITARFLKYDVFVLRVFILYFSRLHIYPHGSFLVFRSLNLMFLVIFLHVDSGGFSVLFISLFF